MAILEGKKIILGVCGSIAAYKAAYLTRLLIKKGANVKVIMTPSATKFITPLTFSTLSNNAVYSEVSSEEGWNNHVELGLWADAMLIAPTTATTLGKLANGICDSMVAAVYLSARCPVFFAPAMDLDMWAHPASQQNVARMQQYGNHLIPVGFGELASGLVGNGRMAEPEEIVAFLEQHFSLPPELSGKKILVTAGPTYEAIDPVRFIGNRSSGKMGIAIAKALAGRGASVVLLLGPTSQQVDNENIKVLRVESAQEMYEAAMKHFPEVHTAVLAAAVADYRPNHIATEKIKKTGDQLRIDLEKTPDIAATLGQIKQAHQTIVGFALETNNELENAKLKLERKNFDFIVLNSLQDKGAGFNVDTNKITILHKNGETKVYELKGKDEVATDIVQEIVALYKLQQDNL
jgi:phosphopantothenoylcysteine decarboxylase/phosphopantothenate--cysteine ligase